MRRIPTVCAIISTRCRHVVTDSPRTAAGTLAAMTGLDAARVVKPEWKNARSSLCIQASVEELGGEDIADRVERRLEAISATHDCQDNTCVELGRQ